MRVRGSGREPHSHRIFPPKSFTPPRQSASRCRRAHRTRAAGEARETWRVADRCPAAVAVAVPAIAGGAPAALRVATAHAAQWSRGEPAAAAAAAAGLTGMWEGDVLVGRQLCAVTLELEELVR